MQPSRNTGRIMPEHANIHEALLAFQAEAPDLPRNGRAQYGDYVTLDDLIRGVRPVLNKHGIYVNQFPVSIDGTPGLRTELVHAASETGVAATTPMLLQRQDPQGHGAALTYMRRYALTAALGLANDADDDAQSVSAPVQTTQRRTTASQPARSPNGRAPV